MLEDTRMEKKIINRSSQPPPRASAVDCKKNSDSTAKPWPKYNKKRDGNPNSSKTEPFRRNGPSQNGRSQFDRRPHPRSFKNYSSGGVEKTGLELDNEPEFGSVFVPGSKKQNLNHLLNFMYSPRSQQEHLGTPQRRKQQLNNHAFNSELFLQACCQFVVREEGDYKQNLLDPDVPVKWDLIEEIIVRSTGKSECPICLGAPVAGRVGRCGHVYCWACALHYAEAHERQPPPCPVCAAPFRVDVMKPARILQWDSPAEEITMRLVRRPRGSTVVEIAPPRGQTIAPSSEIQPFTDIYHAPYAKIFSANGEQIYDILKRERAELENQILLEIDTTEVVFMEQALEALKKREQLITTVSNVTKNEIDMKVSQEAPIVYEKHVVNDNKLDWFDVTDDGACANDLQDNACAIDLQDNACALNMQEVINNMQKVTLNPDAEEFKIADIEFEEFPITDENDGGLQEDGEVLNDLDKENQAKYFYFYQADDGQQVFLNSLNVRLLNASWGALAAAPLVIKGRVLNRETFSLTQQTRKHMPYTAHLPIHCPFDIVEIDLRPPFVTKSALESYSDELDRRAKIRARQQRDERRRERAYRRTIEGPPKPDFSSQVLFPPTSPTTHHDTEMMHIDMGPTPSALPQSPPTVSFAKMASSSGAWRVRASAPAPPPLVEEEPSPLARPLSLSDAIAAAIAQPQQKKKKNKKNKNNANNN